MMDYGFRVLLICTGNSCRSQMAEGLVRYYFGERMVVQSAGVLESYVHTYAIKVMDEIGIDISKQKSKHVEKFEGWDFDLVITLCSYAKEICGNLPWAKEQVHMEFDDPIGTIGDPDEVLDAFRETRDDIRRRLLPFIQERYEGWRFKKEKEI